MKMLLLLLLLILLPSEVTGQTVTTPAETFWDTYLEFLAESMNFWNAYVDYVKKQLTFGEFVVEQLGTALDDAKILVRDRMRMAGKTIGDFLVNLMKKELFKTTQPPATTPPSISATFAV